jgi:uncharacterized protein (DUF983 family)
MPIETPSTARQVAATPRDVAQALRRGSRCRCPACGSGRLFRAYLKVADACPDRCEAPLHQRADDAPAYFTIVIVGHVIVSGILALEKTMAPSTAVHLAIWLPLMSALTLGLLPPVKGALVALQWALRMHGFAAGRDAAEPDPAAAARARVDGART